MTTVQRHRRHAAPHPTELVSAALVVFVCAALGIGELRALAQASSGSTQPPPTVFASASVKPHTSADPHMSMVAQPGGRFVAVNVPARLLIRTAYQLQDSQITGGPNWIGSAGFDIEARADAPNAPGADFLARLQALLADRFKLVAHHDMKELPVYAMMRVASNGTLGHAMRVTECPPVDVDLARPTRCANVSWASGRLTMRGTPLAGFLGFLAPYVDRVIVDRTGLDERYDIDLTWKAGLPTAASGDASSDANGASIFTALPEQLGLRLEPTTAPVDVLVIDTIDRPTPD